MACYVSKYSEIPTFQVSLIQETQSIVCDITTTGQGGGDGEGRAKEEWCGVT